MPPPPHPIRHLLDIMAQLRDTQRGCPWDIEQDFVSIAPYTIEEAYEVADAIDSGDRTALCEELGDLLLQVVFHAQMAREEGSFDFDDVVRAVCAKMISRHPHVFAGAGSRSIEAQSAAWEAQKAAERAAKQPPSGRVSLLADVALALPALMRAEKLTKRAARAGFDWPDAAAVFAKLAEETAEVKAELNAPSPDPDRIEDEVGDMLFVVANLARKLGVDPEAALRRANKKFTRRFQYIEDRLTDQGKTPQKSNLEEMDRLWNEAKRLQTRGDNSCKYKS